VVSSWWSDEARRYGVHFEQHDDRYGRTAEWLSILNGAWTEPSFSYTGKHYRVEDVILEPKPVRKPRPVIYAGGESPAAKALISSQCDAYVMHGDAPARVGEKVTDMEQRRAKLGLPRMIYGVAGYTIVRNDQAEVDRELARITNVAPDSPGYHNYQDWLANTQLENRVTLEEYSVSNRGLRSGLCGSPWQVQDQVVAFEKAGIDLLLLQCSPQLEEMERFAETVIAPLRTRAA